MLKVIQLKHFISYIINTMPKRLIISALLSVCVLKASVVMLRPTTVEKTVSFNHLSQEGCSHQSGTSCHDMLI